MVEFARKSQYEELLVSLAALCAVPIGVVDRLMNADRVEYHSHPLQVGRLELANSQDADRRKTTRRRNLQPRFRCRLRQFRAPFADHQAASGSCDFFGRCNIGSARAASARFPYSEGQVAGTPALAPRFCLIARPGEVSPRSPPVISAFGNPFKIGGSHHVAERPEPRNPRCPWKSEIRRQDAVHGLSRRCWKVQKRRFQWRRLGQGSG